MFAIIRTRWQTRPLSRRAKRRSSAARGSPRKKYAGRLHPPKHGTLAHQVYHIWESLEAGITAAVPLGEREPIAAPPGMISRPGVLAGQRRERRFRTRYY